MEIKQETNTTASSRKRGYRTFDRVIEEREREIIDLESNTQPFARKRKRTITVLDLTQDDSDDDDEILFSPASKRRDKRFSQYESHNSTCVSCAENKPSKAFHQEPISGGGFICTLCWEANFTAEVRHTAQKEEECSICYDSFPAHRFPTRPHAGIGENMHSVCMACWERHLHSEIERKAWDKLTCPQDGCGKVLEYGEISVLERGFERPVEPIIAAKATATYLSSEETYFACPSARCKSGIFLDAADHNHGTFTCEACGYRFCFACKVPMHTGQSCLDYQDSINGNTKRAEQEAASKALVEGTYKTCPNKKCGARLELMSGCDHVVCLSCKRKFNWSSVPDPKTVARLGRL